MMRAATAWFDITPSVGPILQGHWSSNPSTEVLFPLEGRVLLVRDDDQPPVVIVTLDLLAVPLAFTQRIRTTATNRHGIPPENILIAASHTHCAPAMLAILGLTPDPAYVAMLEERIADAIAQCLTNCTTVVTFGVGASETYFHINRRLPVGQTIGGAHPAGVIDPRVRALRIDNAANGHPLAILFHFSCHPTSIAGSGGRISPDYPGIARQAIEARTGATALFLPGCFGNIRPAHMQGNGFRDATDAELIATGKLVASAAIRAVDALRCSPHDGASGQLAQLQLDYERKNPDQKLQELLAIHPDTGKDLFPQWHARARAWLSEEKPRPLMSEMQRLTIGPVTLITMPGEAVQEIGYAIERSAERAGLTHIWAMGYCNDGVGYLVTERQKSEGGYEPNAYPYMDNPAPFREEETLLTKVAAQLLARQTIR